MRTVSLLTLFGFTAILSAQTTPTKATVVLQPAAQSCPVGFTARHAEAGTMVQVRPGSKAPQPGYRLTFTPAVSRSLTQAKVTLHGISGAHVISAGAKDNNDSAGEAAESFTVAPSSGANHLFHATVYAEKLTGVQWVELNEVTYADGSQWHESAGSLCRVAPNGFMLVAAAR